MGDDNPRVGGRASRWTVPQVDLGPMVRPDLSGQAPAYIPPNLNFGALPQGWEALRYAQAAVPRSPGLSPPNIGVHTQGSAGGLTTPNEISLTPEALNAAAFPYVPPETVDDSSQLQGILPHELTHYLNLHAPGVHDRATAEQWAEQRRRELGTYHPMFAEPTINVNANFRERLANRVQLPFVDAQEVGRRYQMFQDQGKQVPISSKRISDSMFKNNV